MCVGYSVLKTYDKELFSHSKFNDMVVQMSLRFDWRKHKNVWLFVVNHIMLAA